MEEQGFFFDTLGTTSCPSSKKAAWNDPEERNKTIRSSRKTKKLSKLRDSDSIRSYRTSQSDSSVKTFDSQLARTDGDDSILSLENTARVKVQTKLKCMDSHDALPLFAFSEYKKFTIMSGSYEGYRMEHSMKPRSGPFDKCAFAHDSIICYGNSDAISLFDINSQKEMTHRSLTTNNISISKLAVSGSNLAIFVDETGSLSILDTRSMKVSQKIPYVNVSTASFGKDETSIFLGNKDGNVIHYDVRKSKASSMLNSPYGAITGLSFNLPSSELLCGYESGYCSVIDSVDTSSLKEITTYDNISTPIDCITSSKSIGYSLLSSFDSRHAIKIFTHDTNNFIHASHLSPVPSKCRASCWVGRDTLVLASESQIFTYKVTTK